MICKNMNYILCEEMEEKGTESSDKKIAIAACLYYSETLDKCLRYLENIPVKYDVYIISSKQELLDQVKKRMGERRNCCFIEKENRGRDVSALLVTFRKYFMSYDYVCFIHDKKARYSYLAEDTDLWTQNLWDNMLKSEAYISNVLEIFEKEGIGLLVPPCPMGKYLDSWYANAWGVNFDNTQKLAVELGLDCCMEYGRSPIAIGTVFWCKTDALGGLFKKNWTYEDFPQEPLAYDGTISHAVERILPFVAQDAGYDTATVMCSSYAQKLLTIAQEKLKKTYLWLWDCLGIENTYQLEGLSEERKQVEEMFRQFQKVYLYGAGQYGEKYLRRLAIWGYEPAGFVVSDGKRERETFCGRPVLELSELDLEDSVGIILSTNTELQRVIADTLAGRNFHDYICAEILL